MRIILLDARLMTSKDTVHAYLQEELGREEYVGQNLDALYDVLSTWDEETTLVIAYTEELALEEDSYGKKVLNVFQEVALESETLTIEIE